MFIQKIGLKFEKIVNCSSIEVSISNVFLLFKYGNLNKNFTSIIIIIIIIKYKERLFICWITLLAGLKNWDFKKKKRFCVMPIFWWHGWSPKSNDFKTPINLGKLCQITIKRAFVNFFLRSPIWKNLAGKT